MRTKTPSFILELPLKTSKKKEEELLSRLESARQLYNATLGEAKKRVSLIKQSKDYQKAIRIPKAPKDSEKPQDRKNNKLRKELFDKTNHAYKFNEYSLHKYIGNLRHKIPNNLDIQTTQKLATRAFKAVSKILYGTARKVRFKGYNQFNSVESKSNVTGIRWKNNKIEWNKLSLEPIIDPNDEVISHGLKHKVKYCRIFRKIIKNKNRFYVQLVLQGFPLVKEKNKLGKGVVCFDLGPSTIATVTLDKDGKFSAELKQFCSELDPKQKEIANLQRKIERQRRHNNPNNYEDGNGKGKIKKGKLKWVKSKNQIRTQAQLFELHRKISAYRKSLQGKLINETLRKGDVFKTEKISKKWLQKMYGKSVGTRAPAMYSSGMKRKAESAGASSYTEFPTSTTKLSQVCICKRQKKKKLSDRVHDCECGVCCQRDLFSAYLGLFVEKAEDNKYILQTDQAERYWSSVDKLLQVVWRNSVQSTSRRTSPSSFGKPRISKAIQSQSGSLAELEIAKFEVWNVVTNACRISESPEENKVFSPEPAGF